jgi:PST family polysaccharide transporter
MGLFNSFLLAGGWVYTALGTVRRQLHWDVFNLVVLTLSFLVGVHWGALGVALAASATCVVLRIPSLAFCFRGTPLRLRDMGSVLWRPLLATTLAAALVLGVRLAWGTPGPAFGVVLRDGVVFALGYALGWVLVPGWKNFLRHELRRPEPAP